MVILKNRFKEVYFVLFALKESFTPGSFEKIVIVESLAFE